MRVANRETGQATVELALTLPALALVLGAIVEVSLVAGDQVRLVHAAREAARVAVVDPDLSAVRAVAEKSGLSDLELKVEPSSAYRVQGEPLNVEASAHPDGRVPLIGILFEHLELHATATMRIEEP